MDNLGVGIIGSGFMGRMHGLRYKSIKDITYLAVCDKKIERAKELKTKMGADKAYSDYTEMVRDKKVDIIDVCLPNPLHTNPTILAAEAGKHVLCEKPIALDLKQADRMIKATRKAHVKFMVAHVLRFWPEYVTMKEIITTGDLGEPLLARFTRLIMLPRWWEDPISMGGAAIDVQVHDIDYALWLFGKPRSLIAKGKILKDSRDHIMTLIDHESGVKSLTEASVTVPDSFPFTMESRISCEKGIIELSIRPNVEPYNTLIVYKPTNSPGFWGPEHPPLPASDGFSEEIKYFVECVKNDKDPTRCPPEDSRLALKISLDSIESMKTDKWQTYS